MPGEQRKQLPIPLTCHPQVKDGKCAYGFDNGACRLSDQFMCPYYLWFEKTYPHKVGDIPQEMVDRIMAEQPIDLKLPVEFIAGIRKKLEGEHGEEKVGSEDLKSGRRGGSKAKQPKEKKAGRVRAQHVSGGVRKSAARKKNAAK